MSHHCHIRVTPYEFEYDLSGLLMDGEKYIVAQEKGGITFKPHYHIFMYTDVCEKTIRNHIQRYFNIPVGTKGAASKYYMLKYDKYNDPDPSYVCKEIYDVSGTMAGLVATQGYTPAEVQEFLESGKKKYGPGSDYHKKKHPELYRMTPANSTPVKGPKSEEESPAKDEWSKLLQAYEDAYYDADSKHKEDTMKDIEKWIKHYYLARSRPIPRAGDLARYRYSLYAIVVQDKLDVEAADNHENKIYGIIY